MVLNPVRANLVELPEHWEWGSYRAAAGISKESAFLTVDWLLSLFGTDKKIAQQQYRIFVRAGISKKPPWDEIDGHVLLGRKGFVKQFKDLLKEKENLIEIPLKYGYTLKEVADYLGLHQTTVSKIVRRLLESGADIVQLSGGK